MSDDAYWTPKQAAAHLGIHHRTFLGWLRNGAEGTATSKPPHTRLNCNLIRIPVARFKKWADARTHKD